MIPSEALHWWYRLASLAVGRITAPGELGARWDGVGVHRHRISTLVVALAGPVRVELGAHRHLDLTEGEVAVLGPWCWHAHPAPRRGAAALIGATAQGVDLALVWPGGEWRAQTTDQESGRRLAALTSDLDSTALTAAVVAVLRGLAAIAPVASAATLPAQQMADFLWRHRTSPVSAAAVLAASGLQPRAAHTAFVAHFGATPKQYLLQCRLALAQQLLLAGQAPGEVWRECGFRSRADLSRRFRLVCGAAPRRWLRARAVGRTARRD
jgi:AraC-like DNA-binding protein